MKEKMKFSSVVVSHHPPRQAARGRQNNPLRVAAYARVSTLQEHQEESFQTQCAYYAALIGTREDAVLVGVYGDQGASGLRTRGRPELARMMADCQAGKIDAVVTRSVSRFSRNMAECLELVEQLKALGIPVRFEKEGVTSTDPGSEFFFHVLAILAQEESGSHSRRVSWASEKRAQVGDPVRKCAYGYRKGEPTAGQDTAGGRGWVIQEGEAGRVKLAFALAAQACPYGQIIGRLDQMEQAEGTAVRWNYGRLRRMLGNEAYRGDVLAYKTYTLDYVSRKRAVNQGARRQYYISEHHEALVSPETYERVQRLVEAGMLKSRPEPWTEGGGSGYDL